MRLRDSFKLLQEQDTTGPCCSFHLLEKNTKTEGIPENLSNYFKNQRRDHKDSFKLLQEQDTSGP